jgi:hypothetical protein
MNRSNSQPENHELSFTLDISDMTAEDARSLVEKVSGYGVTDLAIYGADAHNVLQKVVTGGPTSLLQYSSLLTSSLRLQISLDTVEAENASDERYFRVVVKSPSYEKDRHIRLLSQREAQQRAQGIGVPVEALCLVHGHAFLRRNYLVSAREDVSKAAKEMYRRGRAVSDMFKGQSQHYITPDQVDGTLKRLQRLRGEYYLRPHHTIKPRSFYYREVMLQEVPAYQPMWSTAVFGIKEANLEPDLEPLGSSLDHRMTALLQVRDDLEQHAHEVADNGTRWEMLNLLQYFAMLATGLFDNLAWLTAVRYGFYREYMDDEGKRRSVMLRIRKDANGQLLPNQFHYKIQNANRKLYDLIVSVQDLMDVLYPIRDSVQHRFILGTIIWHNNNEGWSRVMIDLPGESYAALTRYEARAPGSLKSWGHYPSGIPGRQSIEPSTFAKQAMEELLTFTQSALSLMNFPDMVAAYPALHAKVLAPRSRF